MNGRLDFLKYAITYSENRIALLDRKASILIAIQAALFASFTFAAKCIATGEQSANSRTVTQILLLAFVALTAATIILLILTIRPTKCLFALKVDVEPLLEKEKRVMWFADDFPLPKENYQTRIGSPDIQGNYEHVHFVALQLLKRKYRYYSVAILLMKVATFVAALGVLIALKDF
jgi:hypothetical protein